MKPRPRLLALSEVEVSLTVKQYDQPVRGSFASGDAAWDREIEDEIIGRLNDGDVWAWCEITVRVTWKGHTGGAYLWGCSYRDEQDFIENSGYFDEMVTEALENLNGEVKEAYETLRVLCQ